jgi:hypothetical protein
MSPMNIRTKIQGSQGLSFLDLSWIQCSKLRTLVIFQFHVSSMHESNLRSMKELASTDLCTFLNTQFTAHHLDRCSCISVICCCICVISPPFVIGGMSSSEIQGARGIIRDSQGPGPATGVVAGCDLRSVVSFAGWHGAERIANGRCVTKKPASLCGLGIWPDVKELA